MKEMVMPSGDQPVLPMKSRVLLECETEEIATSHLCMENSGTTTVYYSWEVC